MKSLREFELIVRAADAGSLSAAARQLDLTPAAASAALKRIEAEIGTPIFVRSTRSLRTTPAGDIFLRHCREGLQHIGTAFDEIRTKSERIQGVLQVSLPSDFGRNVVLGWLDEFQSEHPALELRIDLSDRLADVFRQPVDVALRYGTPADSSLIALPIAPHNRRVLCASPEYLAHHGTPTSPAELAAHNCLCFVLGDEIHHRWRFAGPEGERSITVRGNRVSSDGEAVRRWALAGLGIAYKSQLDIAQDLAAGRLVQLLPELRGEAAPLHLMCPDRRQITPPIQALRLFLSDNCARPPFGPP